MPHPTGIPEPDQQVADAARGNWVDRWAPAASRPYLRLSRADRPIGTWLLLIPCWWALALAMAADPVGPRWQDLWIALGCGIGAFVMRGAGCTWNDITDRHIDAQVARTRSRPLPSGQVTVRQALVWMVVQTLIFACLFGTISSTQQIFDVHFGRGAEFPLWFALIALCSGSASLINAALVVRLGMRFLVSVTLAVEALLTAVYALTLIAGGLPEGLAFALFVIWAISVFMMAGLVLGNLNALAMEPVGHIAGLSASVISALATVGSVLLAVPVGQAFDGTLTPLLLGVAVFTAAALALIRRS